jgi:hypothetical protein
MIWANTADMNKYEERYLNWPFHGCACCKFIKRELLRINLDSEGTLLTLNSSFVIDYLSTANQSDAFRLASGCSSTLRH